MNKLRIIHIMLKAFKALILAGALFAVIFFMLLPNGYLIQIGSPFWLVQNPEMIQKITEILPKMDPVNFIDIQTDMEVPLTMSLKLLISFFILSVSSFFFYLLYVAQQVVKDIRSGHSFTHLNIKRIKIMGILIAVSFVGERILTGIGNIWFRKNYQFEGLELVSVLQLGWYIVIIGAIIFALGAAFEQGLKLQEEQELTI